MANVILPRVQAMVLCDEVVESEYELDVYHLNGVRSVIESPFPAVVPRLCVFVQMSGHQGQASCHIEIEHSDESEIILETDPRPITFDGPNSVVPIVFPLDNCVFPAPGLYYIQLYHQRKLIGERPLYLRDED